MMEARQFSLPQHLAAQCSDKILMHINRPSNFQQTIDLSFEDFSQGLYTDVTLATDDGVKTKIHGFLLSAASPFLCDVFNNTFSPNLEYCILLPEVSSSVVSCLAQLLYGATVITCRETLVQLYRLVDILAIQLSLVTTIQEEVEETDQDVSKAIEVDNGVDPPEEVSVPDKEKSADEIIDLQDVEGNHTINIQKDKVEPNPVKMLKIDDKNNIPSASPVAEETVGPTDADGSSLPLCCWHCSLPFPSFPSLSSHQCCTNTSSPLYRRHHRCPQCGDLLSSMWRLRQHLATHQPVRPGQAVGGSSSDHPYGRSSRRVQPSSVKVQPGDHGYATATLSRSTGAAVPVQEPAEGTPPGSAVHSEHSYGTKRDSSPEDEQRNSFERTDHIYSAATMISETSKDKQAVDDVKSTGREDHQYFQLSERSSPRFRKLLPKEEFNSSSKSSTAASFPCCSCDKSFPQAYRLKRHIREVHDKEKMFKCEECDKKFFKSNSLVRHKIAVHDKIRPFSCPNCDSRFKDRSALKYHTKKNVCILK